MPLNPYLLPLQIQLDIMGTSDNRVYAYYAPDPVLLKAGPKPFGGDKIYPSPMMFDLDGDKRLEMYVADLMGNISLAKRKPGDDPLAWEELRPLIGADDKGVKFSNW